MNKSYKVIVTSNDETILSRNLMASDMIRRDLVDLEIIWEASSASSAYNQALESSDAKIFIFAHQDVYFPPNWETHLAAVIMQVEQRDTNWAIIAPIGISSEGKYVGQVWSTSQGQKIGRYLSEPIAVQSVDELVIILRKESGVRFDDSLPEFHLYGTDIVQNSLSRGYGAYVCQLPVVHNDKFHDKLRSDFANAYEYLRRKWRKILPLKTTVLWITKFGFGLTFYRFRAFKSLKNRREISENIETNPLEFSKFCGWER